jgi:MarR family transcriptional regulator, organic hydroperoxide resistance regulator
MGITPDPGPSTDEETPAVEVWMLLRTLLGQQRRRFLIAASELDLHPAQAGALLQLESPLPMHHLATLLGCDNSNVTGLVDRLEARGLVARQPSADDRRVKHIVLTGTGRDLRHQLLERVGRPTEGLDRLTVAEQLHLRDLLRKMLGSDAPPAARTDRGGSDHAG